jgi:hypothetical protein
MFSAAAACVMLPISQTLTKDSIWRIRKGPSPPRPWADNRKTLPVSGSGLPRSVKVAIPRYPGAIPAASFQSGRKAAACKSLNRQPQIAWLQCPALVAQ